VGKTTTIAKLAAQFKLRDRKRVGLITTDTYRIAAVAQLKAYADILSVPLEVVYTPDELAETMRKMHGFDVVLIDTSGRSQKDTEHLGDLQAFLNKARETAAAQELEATAGTDEGNGGQSRKDGRSSALETHLVLSCTAHANQLQQVLEKFSSVGVDRVAFTKLDEAVGVGVILNIAHRLDVQLSYLTTGQDVPDDIEVGSRRRLAELVLNLPASVTSAAPAASAAEPGRVAPEQTKKPAPAINQLA
jgi:flagellar biosynthesis protein FlhF